MAFLRKTWKDRITEYPNRRLLTKEDGSTELVTVAREEGEISQEGDAFSSSNMNDLEKRIGEEFDAINSSLNVRYDPETDFIQAFFNDNWVNVLLANVNIKTRNIFIANGSNDTENWLSLKSGASSSQCTLTISNEKIYQYADGNSNTAFIYNEEIDFIKFSKLHVKYQVTWAATSAGSGTAGIGIASDINNDMNFIDNYAIKYSTLSNTGILEKTIDISDLKSSGYIKASCAHSSSYGIYLTVYEIWLEV